MELDTQEDNDDDLDYLDLDLGLPGWPDVARILGEFDKSFAGTIMSHVTRLLWFHAKLLAAAKWVRTCRAIN